MMTELNMFAVQTASLGEIEVPAENIIHFEEGIPGFPNLRLFALLELERLKPFRYLQSMDNPMVALLVVDPFLFHPTYKSKLANTDLNLDGLQIQADTQVVVYAVATIPADPSEATLNLMAPILINQRDRCGKQVILADSELSIQHPLVRTMECQDAGSV
jgi:flagellar assembly factor FliW